MISVSNLEEYFTAVGNKCETGEYILCFNMSVGIARIKDETTSHEITLVEAQEAMSRAKQLGRNCYYAQEV